MTSSATDVITIESDGPIRILTINRPDHHNAVNAELHHRFGTIWADVASDSEARAAVLTGAGDAFSAGGDFDFMLDVREADRRWAAMEEARLIISEILRFPLPLVAAVNGPAVGLGASVALMSDLVVMADTAHLADPHVTVGLVAGDGGAATWPAHTSMLWAKEFLFLGDPVPAERALAMGLANRVVPAADLMSTARDLASRLASLPAHALRDTKRALNLGLEQYSAVTRDYALGAERYSMGDTDHQAFLDRLVAKRRRND